MSEKRVLSRRFLGTLVAAALVGCVGCAGGKTASASGKVSYKGKAVTSGTVVLVGADGRASQIGAVKPDGTYQIAEAPVGTVTVSFDNPPPPRVQKRPGVVDPEAKEAAETAARYVATPAHYKDPAKSKLTLELKPGKNDNADIDLR